VKATMGARAKLVAAMLGAAALGFGGGASGPLAAAEPPPGNSALKTNPQLLNLEPNKWVKLHEQKATDEPPFKSVGPFALCYDSKRGRIVLMGGGCSGVPANSPLFFDVATATWSRPYPDDGYETYKVNENGFHVSGEKGDRPWVGQIFSGLVYDPERDELVLCAEDNYLGRAYPAFDKDSGSGGDAATGKFPTFKGAKVKKGTYYSEQPVWVMNLEEKRWSLLPAMRPTEHGHFFSPAVYVPELKTIVGVSWGVYELSGDRSKLECLHARGGGPGCSGGAYDLKNKVLLFCGLGYGVADDVWAYDRVKNERPRKMPTPGARPPKAGLVPLVHDAGNGKTVAVFFDGPDKPDAAGTWLYDYGADAWKRIPDGNLTFEKNTWQWGRPNGYAINMVYDSHHQACLLVSRSLAKPQPTVWALKIDEGRLQPQKPGG
jgi:hypothetical protein